MQTAVHRPAPPVKALLTNSYKKPSKQAKQIDGLTRDDELSGRRAQVYHSDGNAFIVHRGSASAKDWLITNPAVALGLQAKTDRFRHAKDISRQAKAKYGNVTTLGHSLGGRIALNTAGGSRAVAVNPAVALQDARRPRRNETIIRHRADIPSAALALTGGGPGLIQRGSLTESPWAAHSLNRTLGGYRTLG